MNFREAVDWILGFTDYEQLPGSSYAAANFDLRRMELLMNALDNPHMASRTIHIAGSKGKGSTAAMIASSLSSAGYSVALYTSPHLITIRERMMINGKYISPEQFGKLTSLLFPKVNAINKTANYGKLTTFEILTALAFCYFRENKVDFQVVEVGMGGRLDATNIVKPEITVITSISIDHTAILGNTLTEIAGEKCGIIKSKVPLVTSPQKPEVMTVIKDFCDRLNSNLTSIGNDYSWERLKHSLNEQSFHLKTTRAAYVLTTPLLGDHQIENAATAVSALEILKVEKNAIQAGLLNVHWPGRLEILMKEPATLVVDGAHNTDSAKKLIEAIKQYFNYRYLIMIIGISADKDIKGIVNVLAPSCKIVYTTRSRNPRSADPIALASEFSKCGITSFVTSNVSEAISQALTSAGEHDLICATGSLFVVAEVIERMKGLCPEVYSL
ncbi:MAG: bifunctional folylpolyglutamate synthase/dihydrofolate synthase [Chloroflexi bacterium]|nr:bifunctional folylpolyglutamate synthase/dihydrofolate synthase [Chloroflexota bacterium]